MSNSSKKTNKQTKDFQGKIKQSSVMSGYDQLKR